MSHKVTADALADHWLTVMSTVTWGDAAASIRKRLPCGETTTLEEQGVLFDVSDSWAWIGEEGGDIRLTVEVFTANGSDEPLATRVRILARP